MRSLATQAQEVPARQEESCLAGHSILMVVHLSFQLHTFTFVLMPLSASPPDELVCHEGTESEQ